LGLARISRAVTLARECSASATKLPQRYRMRLWTNDDFTSRKRGKCGHAEINADFSFRLGYGLYIVSLDLQSNEPSSRFAWRGCRLQRASEAHRFADLHPTNHRQLDALAVGAESADLIGSAKAGAVILAFEAWTAAALLKKGKKSRTQIDDRLLR